MATKIIIILAIIIALIAAWYFLIHLPNQNTISDGVPCQTGGLPGTIKNGICQTQVAQLETLPCGGRLKPC